MFLLVLTIIIIIHTNCCVADKHSNMSSSALFKLLLSVVAIAGLISADPVPDTSEKCQSCMTKVNALDSTWTNATT
jgi:hypothetical protein